ncbi:conserved hypothetical protein [Verticillium alfalfae VaMs.102]|uniref:DOMON domain-containing protein n=1 Tax=Verticillium alfalfae (strain VaMs.102 / ATCC MYA-4576 / FGSC 10136) TaxID=526221 RepID=C9SIK4_VERA1|nr:conserved hypothetical protein [Verticillium alfalfae VaMs.102]EEY18777.1 conserved hypothetical protein [Verticillium alfalfae VaMs.102]
MKSFITSSLAAAALYTSAVADPIRNCPNGNSGVCFQVAVPETAASAGTGNLYFQISAPESYAWIGLGTGTRMSNSNMFLMYQDGSGNVTISPRRASGQVMPQVTTNGAQLELLAGSGVSNGVMTANVRCSNCASWSGGSMPLGSSSSNWIAAWRRGSAISSTNLNAPISQHDSETSFGLDLTQATVAEDTNPFAGSAAPTTGGNTGNSNTGGNTGGITAPASSGLAGPNVLLAHGVIMTIVFVAMYPIGSILMPMLGKWLIHAGWQIIAFMLMWAGFGLGVVYGNDHGYLFKQTHTILGTVVCALLVAQPFLGLVHHMHYKKHQMRGAVSHSHIWFGRIVLLLGIINGGLGMQLASSSTTWIVAYSVVAGIMAVLYVLAIWLKSRRTGGRRKDDLSLGGSPVRESHEMK